MATDEQIAALQLEDELSAEPEDAMAAAARAERLEIHTALPGIVKSFDPATLTVKVQPAIKRRWIDAGFVPLPELVNVPVQFPRGGGFIFTFPVAAGDECLVHFAERAIDDWHEVGGVQKPSEFRLHDLSDGFAALGYSSKPEAAKVTGGAATDAAELRTLDGSTVVRVEPNKVYAGAKAGSQPATLGDVQHAINEAIKNHTHPCTGGTTSPSVELAVPGVIGDVRATKVNVR